MIPLAGLESSYSSSFQRPGKRARAVSEDSHQRDYETKLTMSSHAIPEPLWSHDLDLDLFPLVLDSLLPSDAQPIVDVLGYRSFWRGLPLYGVKKKVGVDSFGEPGRATRKGQDGNEESEGAKRETNSILSDFS